MKEPGLFPGCPVRGCKPVKWRDNGDQVCCGCLRHSSVSLRAPLSESEGTLPALTARRATVQRRSTQTTHSNQCSHAALATSNWLFCLGVKRRQNLICTPERKMSTDTSVFCVSLASVHKHVALTIHSDSSSKKVCCRDVLNTTVGQTSCKRGGGNKCF